MLEGLEVSEISLLKMLDDNPTFRIDAEFFKKEALSMPRFAKALGEVATIKSGTTPADRDDELKEGVVLLKTTDIRNSVLASEDGAEYYRISSEIAERMKATRLCARDVLINIVGATTDVVGRVAFVPDDFPESNITQAMALLRIHDAEIKPATLFAFLAGKYGGLQVRRLARPTGQYNLNLQEVAALRTPVFSTNFSDAITQRVFLSYDLKSQCGNHHRQAEQTLLCALGLESWQPPEPLTYTCRASEALSDERLDAEHFQPKYQAMLGVASRHAVRVRRVDEFAAQCDRGEQPAYDPEGTLAVVNSRHILENGLDYDNFERTDVANWDGKKFASSRILQNDILTYTTGAKVGRTAVYLTDEPALASNHVNMLRVSEENPVYVAAVMNSMVGRWQTNMRVTGSAQVELYPSDIRQFLIPFVDTATEKKIVEAVQSAHAARQQAHGLLEAAKRAVEIAIEDSEAAALDYLHLQGV